MVGAMYFNIRSFLHLVGASGQKESCAINLDNEYVFLLKIEKQLKIKNQKETLLPIENESVKHNLIDSFSVCVIDVCNYIYTCFYFNKQHV